jgi:integrase
MDQAAEAIDNPQGRAWFDVTRFSGMRKDKANRLQWTDIKFDLGMIRDPAHKDGRVGHMVTAGAGRDRSAEEATRARRQQSAGISRPQLSDQGKKIYSRRRMFERIQKKNRNQACAERSPRLLASEIAARVNDPVVGMKLLRHTNLETRAEYLRTVNDRLEAAVSTFGGKSWGRIRFKKPANKGAKRQQR